MGCTLQKFGANPREFDFWLVCATGQNGSISDSVAKARGTTAGRPGSTAVRGYWPGRPGSKSLWLVEVLYLLKLQPLFYATYLFVSVHLFRVKKRPLLLFQRSIGKCIPFDVGQPAPFLESERAETSASPKRVFSDVLNALRNDYLLYLAATEAEVSDDLQPGVRLEEDLAQLFAAVERSVSSCLTVFGMISFSMSLSTNQ